MPRKIDTEKSLKELSNFRLVLFTSMFAIIMPLGYIIIAYMLINIFREREAIQFILPTWIVSFFILYIPSIIIFFIIKFVSVCTRNRKAVFLTTLLIIELLSVYFILSAGYEYCRLKGLFIFFSLFWGFISSCVLFIIVNQQNEKTGLAPNFIKKWRK